MPTVEPANEIDGVLIVTPNSFGDERGRFVETYRRSWFPHGREMIQGNRSEKQAGAVVGLHYHLHQADYWSVANGRILVVLHDLRVGSPTEGATLTFPIGSDDDRGVFIPPGVAHGFETLIDSTVTYLVDAYYNPADELGMAWDDPTVASVWGTREPVLSERDQNNPRKADLPVDRMPYWGLRV